MLRKSAILDPSALLSPPAECWQRRILLLGPQRRIAGILNLELPHDGALSKEYVAAAYCTWAAPRQAPATAFYAF